MRKIGLIIIAFACAFGASIHLLRAQAPLGPQLQAAISTQPQTDPFRVLIQLHSPVDLQAATENFRENHIPATDRWHWVMRNLQPQHQIVQQSLQNNLDKAHISLPNCQKFWLAHAWVADADQQAIQFLAQHPAVAHISLESSWTERPIILPRITPIENQPGRSPGGNEIGLERVNAPKLWKMGYTGKGRISMNLDTGVWTEHPAIGHRFLGNFFPLSQCWFGLDFPTPMDKPGSHGTHTLGTTLGLDTANADTIGLAFNAYWIASDVVATSLANVHPLSDFLLAYEWAINPDGDTTTTWDVPDAINNSWGFVIPTDTNMCTSVVSATLDAVEAAGIANVFSAGNDGPGPGTVSYPQHISTNLVNSFTVGAVDGGDTNLTIAGFSSRGPTICPRTGSVLIKPEVSAPGVNVRSALGKSGYGLASGTSMAAPHVTGAVVLLKEAFPNVAGDEILLALYNSAKDLGVSGEDNTYGMGIIDLESAFNLLSQSHTATPPVSSDWDLAIVSFLEPSQEFLCDSVIVPSVLVRNIGTNSISAFDLKYAINGGAFQTQNWSGNLAPGQSDTLILPVLQVGNIGSNELFAEVQLGSTITESDTVNNRHYIRFRRQAVRQSPYYEDFELVDFNNSDWHIFNEDADITWDTISLPGAVSGTHSVYINLPDYLPKVRQRDELISPEITLPDTDVVTLNFTVAYQHRHSVFSDSLEVWLSTDCGQSWNDRVYSKGGADLSTHDTVTAKFIPSHPLHWRTESVDLSAYAGIGDVGLKWVSVNNKGNYIFLDDIRIAAGPNVGTADPIEKGAFSLFPNPAQEKISLRFPKDWQGKSVSVEFWQVTGKQLGETFYFNAVGTEAEIDLSGFPTGLYLVKACAGKACQTARMVHF